MTAMENMTDKELDKLLGAMKQPDLPKGFADRLQAKLDQDAVTNVIAFPKQRATQTQSRRIWLSALPLAASLIIGIFLGAAGTIPESLSGVQTAFLGETESSSSVGTEEMEDFINGDLS
jgi:uncharacterized transporter YbjL